MILDILFNNDALYDTYFFTGEAIWSACLGNTAQALNIDLPEPVGCMHEVFNYEKITPMINQQKK